MSRVKGWATQMDIARKTGLDTSTVCKVLNGVKGPVFRQKTIDLIMKTAKKMGYRFHRPSKSRLIDMIYKLVGSHPNHATSKICHEALELVAKAEEFRK